MKKITSFTDCLKCETLDTVLVNIVVLKKCEKELEAFPQKILMEMLDLLALLNKGLKLQMPKSRPMPSIFSGCHELRMSDQTGSYRILYYLKVNDSIFLIHAFKKKTEKTPKRSIDVTKKRIKEII